MDRGAIEVGLQHLWYALPRCLIAMETYNDDVPWTTDDALRALCENAEKAKELRIELTDDYLAMIDYLERLPENQPGAHKTDHWQGTRRYLDSFKHAKLMPRRL